MDLSPKAITAAARSDYGQKAIKYAAVSMVGVVITVILLFVFQAKAIGWSPTVANVAAVSISSIPTYFLNRAWVWGKTGKNSFTREVLPFWGFAFAGLVLSTLLVSFASTHTGTTHASLSGTPPHVVHTVTRTFGEKLIILFANLTGFGLLWIARFFVLDKLLFGKEKVEGETLLEHLAEDAPFA